MVVCMTYWQSSVPLTCTYDVSVLYNFDSNVTSRAGSLVPSTTSVADIHQPSMVLLKLAVGECLVGHEALASHLHLLYGRCLREALSGEAWSALREIALCVEACEGFIDAHIGTCFVQFSCMEDWPVPAWHSLYACSLPLCCTRYISSQADPGPW